MLNFNPITLEDRDWISAYYRKKDVSCAVYSFAINYTWRDAYPMEVCQEDGFFFGKTKIKETTSFLCPMGNGDLKKAIDKIKEYCCENDLPVKIHGILQEDKEKLAEIYGDKITFKSSRDDAEYIYDRDALAELKGKKYHGKRNHIKRFMDKDWSYEPITKDNINECISMQAQWLKLNNSDEEKSKLEESCAAMKTLKNFFTLGLKGGLLRQDGKVVAYTIGEAIGNSTFAVHFEKAFADVQGAYPTINQQFVRAETEGFRYINREEDVGSEGLRKAKLSYHPTFLLEKYRAVLTED